VSEEPAPKELVSQAGLFVVLQLQVSRGSLAVWNLKERFYFSG